MKKLSNKMLSLIIVAVVAVIYNILVFATADLHNEVISSYNVFWWAYAFSMMGFVAFALAVLITKIDRDAIFSVYAPVYLGAGIYALIMLIVNAIFMIVQQNRDYQVKGPMSLVPLLVIDLILTLVFVIYMIVTYMGLRHISDDSKKTYAKVKDLRMTVAKVNALMPLAKDEDVKSAIAKFSDALRFSDPMGVEATQSVEDQIDAHISEIEALLRKNSELSYMADLMANESPEGASEYKKKLIENKGATVVAVNYAISLVKQRNEILKASK